jgi:hypothetical protein
MKEFTQTGRQIGIRAVTLDTQTIAIAFWALVSLSCILALTYMWFINASILNIVERKHVSSQNHADMTALAPLESQYLSLTQTLDLERAHQLGFVDVGTVEYASRGSTGRQVSLAN